MAVRRIVFWKFESSQPSHTVGLNGMRRNEGWVHFAFNASPHIAIGNVPVMRSRRTCVGDAGHDLHCNTCGIAESNLLIGLATAPRISAAQAYHAFAALGPTDHKSLDFVWVVWKRTHIDRHLLCL